MDLFAALTPTRRATRVDQLQEQVDLLLRSLRIAVVHGGDKDVEGAVLFKSYNPRSWKSYQVVAEDIAASLERVGARHVEVFADDMRLGSKLAAAGTEFVWLNTGGVQGAGSVSHAAAALEMLGVPYIGHDPITAGILDAKHTFKRLMLGASIPTAEFMTWHGARGRFDPHANPRFTGVFRGYEGPFIVKPVSGRASLHVEYVETVADLAETVDAVFGATQSDVLIERYLGGREYCVAVCGPVIRRSGLLQRLDAPFSFACVERVLAEDEHVFTSMDKKPITGERVRPLDPVKDAVEIAKLEALSARVFDELSLETLVRLDVRADDKGDLYILETNPKPDLKAPTVNGVISLIAAGLKDCGLGYDDLIYSLFADQIDVLMRKRRGSVHHLLEKLAEAKLVAPA